MNGFRPTTIKLGQEYQKIGVMGYFGRAGAAATQWLTALTDWAKRKPLTINGAAKTATYTDNFGSDGWTDSSADLGVAGGVFAFDTPATNVSEASVLDLGATLSDTKWVMDFDLDFTTISGGTTDGALVWIGMADTVQTTTLGPQDGIFFAFSAETSSQEWGADDVDGGSLTAAISHQSNVNLATGTTYYVRIIRKDATNYSITLYLDSARTEVFGTVNGTCASTTTGLQYAKCIINGATTANNIVGSFDNLAIYDGETTVENIPSQQTATVDEDFTSYANTTTFDAAFPTTDTAQLRGNPTNDNIDIDVDLSGGANNTETLVGDINGGVISDERWVLQCEVDLTEGTQGASANNLTLNIGMSDTDESTDTNTNQDYIGYIYRLDNAENDIECVGANGTQPIGGSSSVFTKNVGVTTDYVRISRLSTTLMKVQFFTDNTYTVVSEEKSFAISASIVNLRYFKIGTWILGNTDHDIGGTVNNIKFWDNVTEVNPSALTDYPLTVKIQGDADLQQKTAEAYDSDFSSATGWTSSDSGAIDVDTTDERIEYSLAISNASNNDTIAYNHGSTLSDSNWVIDFDHVFTVKSGGNQFVNFWMSSNDQSNGHGATQDALGFRIRQTGSNYIQGVEADGATLGSSAGNTSYTFNLNQTYYFRIRRTSTTTYEVKVFADSARTIELAQYNDTCAATITSLQYFKIGNFWNDASTGTADGYITKVRIWDGTTNPVTQETATFSDDFTGTDDWDDSHANAGVDTAGDELDFNWNADSTNMQTVYDLGAGGVDEKFVLRVHQLNFSAFVAASNTICFFGLTKSDETLTTVTPDDAVMIVPRYASSAKDWRYSVYDNENFEGTAQDGTIDAEDPATSTDYYLEIIGHGNDVFEFNIYNDSSFSQLRFGTGKVSGIGSPRDLRYIKFANNGAASVGTFTGTIQKVEFWNGVSSPDAQGRKIVFTDNLFDTSGTEYSSETIGYDPINGDLEAVVRVPSLTAGADTTLQMYYEYGPASTPDYVPETMKGIRTPEYDFDFATDTWTDVGTEIAISGGVLNWTSERNDDASAIDLATTIGETIGDKWTLDFDLTFSTVTAPTTADQNLFYFGLFDAAETSRGVTAQSGIYFVLTGISTASPTVDWGVGSSTASNLSLSGDGESTDIGTAPTTTTFYCRLIRESLTLARLIVYSDSAFTTELYNVTIASTVTAALTHLKGCQYNSGTDTGTIDGTIDNLKFYNNINTFDREKTTYDVNYKAVHNLHGNSLDSTAYGNDGTDTSVDWETQNNSTGLVANGTTTEVNIGSDSSIDDIWVGGGHISFWFIAESDGESNFGRIIDKRNVGNGFLIDHNGGDSGGTTGFRFNVDRATTNGIWTIPDINLNQLYHVEIIYNGDDVANDPIIILDGVKQVVSETSTPAGAISTDAAQVACIGNRDNNDATYDGFIGNMKISDKLRPSSESITSYNSEKSDSDIITAGTEATQ